MKILLLLLMLITFQSFANYPVVKGGGVSQWETSTPYVADTIVWDNFDFYRVLLPHTSGVLATDRTNGDIQKMVDPLDYLVGLTGNVQDQFDAQGILIGNNTTAIGTNATNIGTNTTNIGTNATNIGTNTTDIGTNATNIGTNSTNIGTNITNIGTNATNIGTNATDISNHVGDLANPHVVTPTQVGLSNVDNTSDANKPVSTAQQTALDLKADQDLGNLTATDINLSLIPTNNLILDLGGVSNFWNVIYGSDLELKNSSDALVGRVKANTSDLDIRTIQVASPINITTADNGAGNSGDIDLTVGTATGTRGSIVLDGLEIDASTSKIINVVDPTLAQDAATKNYVDTTAVASPAGAIIFYAGTSAPIGFLMCDGTAVSRVTYAALYAIVGDAFGEGDGSTTFNLPDMRGRFARGVDGATGNDPDAAGRTASGTNGNTGDAVGSFQADDFASHTHFKILAPQPAGAGNGTPQSSQSGETQRPTSDAAAGGSETRPVNIALNYIIKY